MLEYALTFSVGFIAGATGAFVGGGGGLVSISFLIMLGFPPGVAIATNRFAAIGASFSAFLRFLRSDKIVWRLIPVFIFLGILGGIIGAEILIKIDEKVLKACVGFALIIMSPLVFIKKDFGTVAKKVPFRSARFFYGCILYFLLMVLGGFFGAGTGVLFILLVIHFFGLTFTQSIATDSLPWAIMSIAALTVLASKGMVDWETGIFLFGGMTAGGWVGAGRALHHGDDAIKICFIIMCVILGIVVMLK